MIIKTDSDEFISYLTDASNLKGNADALYIPQSKYELKEIIGQCYNKNINFTLSGAGTGTTGGRVAQSGVIISTEKLCNIIEFDEKNKTITVESGITLNEINEFLSDKELFYPPNPTESNSSIGGNIANNASGSRSFKYGSTRNFIQELNIILPNGEELILSRADKSIGKLYKVISKEGTIYQFDIPEFDYPKTKNATGYYLMNNMELIDLFIGNEGTLGVVYSAKLKLLAKSDELLGGFVFFENYSAMNNFVNDVRLESKQNFKSNKQKFFSFRLIEFFDTNSLELIKSQGVVIPENAICGIWFEQEYEKHQEEYLLDLIYKKINQYTNLADDTIIATTDKEHSNLNKIRHSLPLAVNEIISKTKFRKIGTDTAVPVELFNTFFDFLINITNSSKIDYIIFGHIGDCHLHCNFFPKNETDFENSLLIYDKIISKTLELKGSVSAEHGIGKIKKQYFELMMGIEKIEDMIRIKKIFDVRMICGMGNLFVINQHLTLEGVLKDNL